MSDSLVHILTRYACDMHPRVTEDEMERAITDTENRYGCDADDFTPAMENDAISLAVERRVARELDSFYRPENCHA